METKELMRYREFQPTAFDTKGLLGEYHGIDDFYVSPTARNRDSDCLAESNFRTALEMLGGESENVQVHRFGHWANGWFEIILVNPEDGERVKALRGISESLADYPVLDEDDYSRLEFEKAGDYWENMSIRERVETCQRFGVSVFSARRNEIPEDYSGELFYYLAE